MLYFPVGYRESVGIIIPHGSVFTANKLDAKPLLTPHLKFSSWHVHEYRSRQMIRYFRNRVVRNETFINQNGPELAHALEQSWKLIIFQRGLSNFREEKERERINIREI